MARIYIGLDNGVTGSMGILKDGLSGFFKVPIKKEQNYTKKRGNVSRIEVNKLREIFEKHIFGMEVITVMLERPMVNPKRWAASLSAVRAMEATMIFLESYGIGYEFCDSKEWQGALLPQGIKGSANLKKASLDIGCRMFPAN
jgi:hypothetical protein